MSKEKNLSADQALKERFAEAEWDADRIYKSAKKGNFNHAGYTFTLVPKWLRGMEAPKGANPISLPKEARNGQHYACYLAVL